MASTYTSRINLELQADGENPNSWGDILNNNVIQLVDDAVAAYTSVTLSSTDYTLTTNDGATDQARSAMLEIVGTVSSDSNLIIPGVSKFYIVKDRSVRQNSSAIKIKTAAGSGYTVEASATKLIFSDGVSVYETDGMGATVCTTDLFAATGNFSACVSTTNLVAATGSFTTKVSGVAAEFSGAVCAATGSFSACVSTTNLVAATGSFTTKVSGVAAEFSGAVCAAEFYGDGSNLTNVAATPRSYLAGMRLSNGTDGDHDINIDAGTAKDSTNSSDITLSSTIVKQIDATWADGTNAGGLASGATLSSNTTYHVFAITVTAGSDAGFDSSATAANLVANNNVSAFRRIGSVVTDGSSNIRQFRQRGDKFLYQNPILSNTDTAIGASSRTTITLNTPSGIVTDAIFTHLLFGTFTDAQYVYRPLAMADVSVVDNAYATAPTSAAMGSLGNRGAGFIEFGGNERLRDFAWEVTCETNTSSQIGVRTQVAGGSADGSDSNAFQTTGWYDSRGKDD